MSCRNRKHDSRPLFNMNMNGYKAKREIAGAAVQARGECP